MEMDLEYQTDVNCKSFADENEYENFSIVSKYEKEIRATGDRARVDAEWRVDPAFENNCFYIQMRLRQLQDRIKSEVDKNPSATYNERTINPMRDWEATYKRLIERNKCVDKEAKQREQESEKKVQEWAKIATSDTPLDIETKASNLNKYLIFGVGGVILIVTVAILLKK